MTTLAAAAGDNEIDMLCGLDANDFVGIVDDDEDDGTDAGAQALHDAAAASKNMFKRAKDALAQLAEAQSSIVYSNTTSSSKNAGELAAPNEDVAKRGAHMVGDDDLVTSFADLEQAEDVFTRAGLCVFPEGAMNEEQIQCHHKNFELEFSRIKHQLAHRGVDQTHSFNFNEVCSRAFGRFDVRDRGTPDLDLFRLHADNEASIAPWSKFVQHVLGESAVELFRGAVINCYGSEAQSWHRDGDPLWPHTHLPPHCLTMFVPLVNVTEAVGPTQFYPGSHDIQQAHRYSGLNDKSLDLQCSLPHCAPFVAKGGALAFDYRVIHRGTGNIDHAHQMDRPVLYFVYSKPWFVDDYNHPSNNPLFA
jgi:ectoine hydroxylase-related dioxygenase (phytanoyl-CoA dioxygenase family)